MIEVVVAIIPSSTAFESLIETRGALLAAKTGPLLVLVEGTLALNETEAGTGVVDASVREELPVETRWLTKGLLGGLTFGVTVVAARS